MWRVTILLIKMLGVGISMSKYWRTVTMYECPDCGALVQDMDDACCHVCKEEEECN